MRLRISALTLCCSAILAGHGQEPRKTIDAASMEALRAWMHPVRAHSPGQLDDPVMTVDGFSYETRDTLNSGMDLFLTALVGAPYNPRGNKAAEDIASLGRGAGRDFLKQAAVLHSDAAAFSDLYPSQASSSVAARTRREREVPAGGTNAHITLTLDDDTPPLLLADGILVNKDGQVVGQVTSSWNWPFARSLLDLLSADIQRPVVVNGHPQPATDPFVSAWYHATTSYMFARGLYGDATAHLHHGAIVLPTDALAWFDRACYAEILGLPMHQALRPPPDVEDKARTRQEPVWTTPKAGPSLLIPAAAQTNAEAERLFRRALERNPSLAEAHVRLGRLLLVRGANDEAAAELPAGLATNPASAVAFYAHLFAGRVAQAGGRLDDAWAHYAAARSLFPAAQSALLASSQLALLRSDVAHAVEPTTLLGEKSSTRDADPWWQYDLAAGRDADMLLRVMWAQVPRD